MPTAWGNLDDRHTPEGFWAGAFGKCEHRRLFDFKARFCAQYVPLFLAILAPVRVATATFTNKIAVSIISLTSLLEFRKEARSLREKAVNDARQSARFANRSTWSVFDPMVISVDRRAAEAKSRLAHVSLLGLNLRLMENWRSVRFAMFGSALDYDTTMILMAIVVISAEKLLRAELDSELQTLARRLPQNRTSRVNFSSIAAATAINRETVRRKVNDLQKAGLVTRDRDGIRIVHGVIQVEVLQEIIEAQLDAIARTVNQLSKFGVLLVNDGPDERHSGSSNPAPAK